MGDEAVRSLIEEVLNSGRSPEEVCLSHPEHLEEVRSRWLRIRDLAGDLERAFPSSGPGWPRRPAGIGGDPKGLPRIPGYELESVIGHGGMGVVYRATHLKLSRMVAVKMLLGGDYAPAKELAGLLREARTVAGLGHPHIVEVYDAGEVDGLPWFTMEFVGGGTLADKLNGVPMAPREAAALVEMLAAAVQVAHDKGVVHRDLKPGNVLLTPAGTPKIADFGLARQMGADAHRTTGGARFGTPSYMAPEQALGTSGAFDSAVDVYALGAILYETLTGRPPFRADSPVETQRQVVSEEPVPPSRINRRVPRDLETICLQCLQKRPSSRYASAGKLHEDLRRYLGSEPIAARKTGPIVRVFKWAQRHPTATTMLAFAMLVTVASIVAVANRLATAAASRSVVEGDLQEVELAQRASDWAAAKSALDRAALHLGAAGPLDLRSRLYTAQRNAEVVKSLEAVRIARALGSGSRESMVQSDREYAALYRDAGGVTDADSPEEAARRIRASTISAALVAAMYDWNLCAQDPPRRDWMLAVLRIADSDQGGWRDRSRDPKVWKDRDAVTRLIAESRVAGQSNDHLLWFAQLISNLGFDPTLLLRKVQSAHSSDFWANYLLAQALYQRGQHIEAMRFNQAAMAIRPDVALVHDNLGNCLRQLNRFDESVERLEEAVRLDPAAPAIRGNIGLTLSMMGRHAEALPHVELGARQWPNDVRFRVHLGHVLAALERDSEAIEQFKQAAALGPGSAMAREALITGFIRARRGREAVSMFRSWVGPESRNYELWDGLAELCLFVGAKEEYEETRKSLLELFGSSSDPVVCEKLCRAAMLAPIPEDQRLVASAAIARALDGAESRPARRPYHQLAMAMSEHRSGRPEETLRLVDDDVSRVLQPLPQLITALALADLDRDAEAMSALARAAVVGDWRLVAASVREGWIGHVLRREAESRLLPKLDEFTRGTYWPSTGEERLALIATSEDRGMCLASARLFAEAFASDPGLARDLATQCRYRAACAAAMCGSGHASDGEALTPEEQSRWRAQSLRWLREELAALRGTTKANRSALLSKWRNDRDLRGVRDPAQLARRAEKERSAFTALWAEVDAALRGSD